MIRLLLVAYYEPTFSDRSHGFRPDRGCHTALREVADTWNGTTWFIEGDISDCFGSLDHQVMASILSERIHDNRFLRLLRNMLEAGYLEDWVWNAALSGAPQGSVVSPILSNIYLDRLDSFVETVLIPHYTRGAHRRSNPAYEKVRRAIKRARRGGDRAAVRELRKQLRSLPSQDPQDPGYRRLRHTRYADDLLLGLTGPNAEAEQIKARLAQLLRDDLNLELSADKTLITHARTGATAHLGYQITVQHVNRRITGGRRATNGTIGLRVPAAVVKAKCAPYVKRGKPERQTRMVNDDDYTIIATYGAEYRGIVQYWLLAGDVYRLDRLHWVMLTSMLKTLACKYDSTVTKMAAKYKATPYGPRRCFQVSVERAGKKPLAARFGGIPLRRQRKAVTTDRQPAPARRKEPICRLRAGRCEICEQTAQVEVHQVRKLADLTQPGRPQPEWARLMAKRRRKTLVVCAACHERIHTRQPTATPTG